MASRLPSESFFSFKNIHFSPHGTCLILILLSFRRWYWNINGINHVDEWLVFSDIMWWNEVGCGKRWPFDAAVSFLGQLWSYIKFRFVKRSKSITFTWFLWLPLFVDILYFPCVLFHTWRYLGLSFLSYGREEQFDDSAIKSKFLKIVAGSRISSNFSPWVQRASPFQS